MLNWWSRVVIYFPPAHHWPRAQQVSWENVVDHLTEDVSRVDILCFLICDINLYSFSNNWAFLHVPTSCNNHWLSISIKSLHQSTFIPSLSRITIISSYLPWTIKLNASNASIYYSPRYFHFYSHLLSYQNIPPSNFNFFHPMTIANELHVHISSIIDGYDSINKLAVTANLIKHWSGETRRDEMRSFSHGL